MLRLSQLRGWGVVLVYTRFALWFIFFTLPPPIFFSSWSSAIAFSPAGPELVRVLAVLL